MHETGNVALSFCKPRTVDWGWKPENVEFLEIGNYWKKIANRDWGYLQSMKPELGVPKIDETGKKKCKQLHMGKNG